MHVRSLQPGTCTGELPVMAAERALPIACLQHHRRPEAMCRRPGLGAALTAVRRTSSSWRSIFLPVEHSAAGEAAVREINREIGIRSMLAERTYGGCESLTSP